jgi:hypothetical protein
LAADWHNPLRIPPTCFHGAAFLPVNDYVLVVVGKAADIKPQLAKFGSWEEKKITHPDF